MGNLSFGYAQPVQEVGPLLHHLPAFRQISDLLQHAQKLRGGSFIDEAVSEIGKDIAGNTLKRVFRITLRPCGFKEAVAVKEFLRLDCGLCAAYCGIHEGHGGYGLLARGYIPPEVPPKEWLSMDFLSRARTICFSYLLAREGLLDCAGLGCCEFWSGKRDLNPYKS